MRCDYSAYLFNLGSDLTRRAEMHGLYILLEKNLHFPDTHDFGLKEIERPHVGKLYRELISRSQNGHYAITRPVHILVAHVAELYAFGMIGSVT